MSRRKREQRVQAVAGAAVLAVAGVAHANGITSVTYDSTDSNTGTFKSFENTGASFTATWTYNSKTDTLTLELINTSTGPDSGAITAIAFNDPGSPLPPPDSGPSELNFVGVTWDKKGSNDNDGDWFEDGVTPPPSNIGNFNSIYTVDGTDYTGAGAGDEGSEKDEIARCAWTITPPRRAPRRWRWRGPRMRRRGARAR